MNKTLMLVICDFLLLSMLALARFDPPEEAPVATLDATASAESAEAELIELLEESLKSELSSKENLAADLSQARTTLQDQARALETNEEQLAETQIALETRELEASKLAEEKQRIEAEKQSIAEQKSLIEEEKAKLEQVVDKTQQELQQTKSEQIRLVENLGDLKETSTAVTVKLDETEKDLAERERLLAEKEAELRKEREARERLAAEQAKLSKALEVALAERRLLEQNLSQEQIEKSQLQAEKELAFARADRLTENVSELGQGLNQLGAGVSNLAEQSQDLQRQSQDLQKELVESRPLTMSEIFTRFQNNSLTIEFTVDESGFFGTNRGRTYQTKTIIAQDRNGDLYAVAHSGGTPLSPTRSSGGPDKIAGRILNDQGAYPINQIAFLSADPRVLYIPLPRNFASALQLEPFELAVTPERWEEAILVKNDSSNFGRAEFRRLTESDRFLRMERPAFGQLFADFASSRGDLAFAKNGRFIGLLTNARHSVVIDEFLASALVNLGPGYSASDFAQTKARLRSRISGLPSSVR